MKPRKNSWAQFAVVVVVVSMLLGIVYGLSWTHKDGHPEIGISEVIEKDTTLQIRTKKVKQKKLLSRSLEEIEEKKAIEEQEEKNAQGDSSSILW